MLAAIFVLLACTAQSPLIRFPVTPAVAAPPTAISKLNADRLYIIDADVPILVLASPQGLVSVTEERGPLRIRGLFVDGVKPETREFKGKQIFIVEATGKGKVELLVVPLGEKTQSQDVLRKTLDVDAGHAPQPPPEPGPTPGDLGPFGGAAGLHVLIVYESGKTLSLAHHSIIYGKAFRDYLAEKCAKVNGTPQRRIYDKDIDTAGESKLWQGAMNRKRESVPWICVGNGTNWFEGPLPSDEAAAMALLRKYGG